VPATKAAANPEHLLTPEPRPPDGDKIATEVEREMEQRLYRLRHVVLPPAEYHVYLHPDDFAHIKDIAPLIELDVQQCLNAAVERMNGRSSLLNFVMPKRPPVEVPRGGWAIHIKPALNGDVGPGELAIHSRLSVPQATKFGSGAGTVRIAQTVVSGTERRTLERDEPHTAAAGAAPARRNTGARTARLTYSDETGEHEFAIAKELVKIGRGGAAHWVDVALVAGSKVSREHCRIRRDAAGRYFIQDVSTWGTFLNGQRVPRFEGAGTEAQERELTDGASIKLADQVTLTFRIG
jgi:pSer/pThr/pTyr-binding forkhead associated (FHA) protein